MKYICVWEMMTKTTSLENIYFLISSSALENKTTVAKGICKNNITVAFYVFNGL